jgi:7,8-dihydroneopterin aldolase/epimerase/oxygenase
MTDDRIILQGMIFDGRHGTLAAERDLGQPFIVDIDLYLDLRAAGAADDLSKTVDYSEVYRQARAIVEGPPMQLTEAVAEAIATAVLEQHRMIEAIRVRVAKPHVRLEGGVLTASAVEIIRRRGQ